MDFLIPSLEAGVTVDRRPVFVLQMHPGPPENAMLSTVSFRSKALLLAVTLAASVAAWSCATTNVAPLTDPAARLRVDKDEIRLFEESDALVQELDRKGMIVHDPELQAYVDGVGSKLIPPLAGERLKFRFVIIRDPTINSFALAQGVICIHSGLLARAENEAQLAHVLAHEISHTVLRHQLRRYRNHENREESANIVGAVLGTGAAVFAGGAGADLVSILVGQTYLAALNGYSRDQEQEADRQGAILAARAGYRVEQAPRLFRALNEFDDLGGVEGFFYADHPSNESRARYIESLIRSGTVQSRPDAMVNAERYQRVTRRIALENVKLRLAVGHYRYALQEAEILLRRSPDDAQAQYLVAEAHRRMAEDPEGAAREDAMRHLKEFKDSMVKEYRERAAGERESARSGFLRSLALDPSITRAHRGLGLLAAEEGKKEEARKELTIYLARGSDVEDKRYIEGVLRKVGR
jgi:predicted Zn-dependent protease